MTRAAADFERSAGRTIVLGDIHGCVHALDALLKEIRPTSNDLIISLGDFIDSGRETSDVVRRLIALEQECRFVAILGNHEEMLLAALTSERLKQSWLMCGGIPTLNSYRFCGDIDVIPDEHLEFIRRCRPFYETPTHIFLHANYLADVALADQPEHVLRWSLFEEPYPEPHCSGKTAVIGHTEQRDGEILDLGHVLCIDTSCHNYGWLTALDVEAGTVWQASRWGAVREGESLGGLEQARRILHSRTGVPGSDQTEPSIGE
ncbi:MAG TPA: metallophosphoesterase [Planctomycetaceae bacterium]|nr:metallophosphoesterase [Planctomycetaceae bacterium]